MGLHPPPTTLHRHGANQMIHGDRAVESRGCDRDDDCDDLDDE
jgi:hypothetical protein